MVKAIALLSDGLDSTLAEWSKKDFEQLRASFSEISNRKVDRELFYIGWTFMLPFLEL